jgi:hypothetical protein
VNEPTSMTFTKTATRFKSIVAHIATVLCHGHVYRD